MANNIDKKEPVAICDQSKIDVTKCDNHELAGNIEPLIKFIRGQQVIFDKDLAKLYGVETKYLNKQVKRNIERFPEDFMSQLTKEECLRCQIGTSNERRGGTRYFPYVFTENGVSMLSSVLRSKTAIEVNIRIMRAFTSMRHFLLYNAEVFQRISTMEYHQLKTNGMRKKNHRYYTYYIIVALLALLPMKGHAQLGINDAPSLEAMISNHKAVRTALDIRMIAELGVEQAHEGSQKSIEEYQESSKRLDKYKRCFDIIDLILNGTATAFHGVRTYQSCSSNIKSYLQLLNEYEEKILLKGKIWSSDTIIYTTSKQTIEDIKSSASSIYKSYIDLSAYLTGTAECKTESMMLCLQCINENMDAIDASVRNAYLTLWSYMTIRLGFWKKEIFRAKTVKEMAMEAYDTWKKSQYVAYNNLQNPSTEKHKALGGGGILGGRTREDI